MPDRRPASSERITARVAEFTRITGLSRNTIYRMLERGDLRSVKFGGCRLILVDSYRDLLSRLDRQEYGTAKSRKSKVLVNND